MSEPVYKDLKTVAGKDGFERDMAKLHNAIIYREHSEQVIDASDRLRKNPSLHNMTNVCVETCRDANYKDASYLGGHLLVISMGMNVALALGCVVLGTIIVVIA